MEDNVLIKIKTYLDTEGSGDEPVELETRGKFGKINGKYYIKYKESKLTGFEDTTTTIKIWDTSASVTRKGKYNMKLEYEQGKQNLFLYPTPYGEFGGAIKTYSVDYKFAGKSGWLKVDYTFDSDMSECQKNSLNVKIQPLASKSAANDKERVDTDEYI